MLQALSFYIFSAVTLGSALMVITARNPVHSVLFLILAFFSSAGLFVLLGAEFLAMLLVVVYVGAVAVLFLFVVMMLDIPVPELKAWFIPKMRDFSVSFGVFLSYVIIFLAASYLMLVALSFLLNWGLGLMAINAIELTRGPLEAMAALRDPFTLDKLHSWSEYLSSCLIILIALMTGRHLATTVMRRTFWKIGHDLVIQTPVGLIVTLVLLVEFIVVMQIWGAIDRDQVQGLLQINAEILLPNSYALGQVLYTDFMYIFQISGLILLVAMIGAIVLTHRTRPDSKRQDIPSQNNRRKEDVIKVVKVNAKEGVTRWT